MCTLPLLAVIASMIWFLEVWANGWAGIGWLKYTHWAVFIIIFLYCVWVIAASTPAISPKFVLFSLACVVAVSGFYFFYFILMFPLAKSMFLGIYIEWINLGPFFIAAATVLLRLILARPTPLLSIFLSLALMYASGPFGRLINLLLFGNRFGNLTVFSWPAENDFIHAIKSGSILILLITGAGLPFAYDHAKKMIPALEGTATDSKRARFLKKYIV